MTGDLYDQLPRAARLHDLEPVLLDELLALFGCRLGRTLDVELSRRHERDFVIRGVKDVRTGFNGGVRP